MRAKQIEEGISDLEKLVHSKIKAPEGQDQIRHLAVLHILHFQCRWPWKTREELSLNAAVSLSSGSQVARRICQWEKAWLEHRFIPIGNRGIKQVLIERGLWAPDLKLECCPKCLKLKKDCCARYLLSQEQDFLSQRGKLQELIEDAGHMVLFYPKFH